MEPNTQSIVDVPSKKIRDANRDAEITWVINPEWATILRGNRDVDHVHIFPRGEFRGIGAARSMGPWLRRRLAPVGELPGEADGRALAPGLARGLAAGDGLGRDEGAAPGSGRSEGSTV